MNMEPTDAGTTAPPVDAVVPEQPVSRSPRRDRLMPRDWLLLPLIGLVTLAVLSFGVEWTARSLYRASDTSTLKCLVLNDAKTGVRGIPQAVCREKVFESPLIQYRFNNCGFRTDQPCGPKPPGTFRIVLLGSSFAEGMRVPQDQTFAARLPALLTQKTGRKVEVYNEAMQWGTPSSIDLRVNQILAAQPDLVLWALTPWDVENVSLILPYVQGVQEGLIRGQTRIMPPPPEAPRNLVERIKLAVQKHGSPAKIVEAAWDRALVPLRDTRSVFMLQHLLYKSQSQYVQHYLMQGDSAGFLRTPTPQVWDERIHRFDSDFQSVANRMRESGVPVVAVLLPHRAQAVMLASGQWPAGYDPRRLGAELQPIVQHDGGTYIDILHDFRAVPDAGRLYLPIDGHMSPQGQGVLAHLLAKELTDGHVPALTRQRAPVNAAGD